MNQRLVFWYNYRLINLMNGNITPQVEIYGFRTHLLSFSVSESSHGSILSHPTNYIPPVLVISDTGHHASVPSHPRLLHAWKTNTHGIFVNLHSLVLKPFPVLVLFPPRRTRTDATPGSLKTKSPPP